MERSRSFAARLCLVLLSLGASFHHTNSFSSVPSSASSSSFNRWATNNKNNNILILDHLNINHEKGRHDWLKTFYVDFLQCALDPRKVQNVDKGRKTLWMNVGAQQLHLPEGKPDAQVLDGIVTLVYPDLNSLETRFKKDKSIQKSLQGSKFAMTRNQGNDVSPPNLLVTDPWGSVFRLIEGRDPDDRDTRGSQAGDKSEGLAMSDLTIFTPPNCNLHGVGRFYEQVLGSVVLDLEPENSCTIAVGPKQTLTFQTNPTSTAESHVDLRDDNVQPPAGAPIFRSNYGPHVSMYVADLSSTYKRTDALGLVYVNPRFQRRAYTLEEAIDDCMFRCLDIVDPENVDDGPILQLEHEVRSVIQRDGSMYKSCPFHEIPEGCVSPS